MCSVLSHPLEDFQHVYPVAEAQDPNKFEPVTHLHEVVPFTTLKDLKQATTTYHNPFYLGFYRAYSTTGYGPKMTGRE